MPLPGSMIIDDGLTLPADRVFELLRAIYESSNAFVADADQEYPSVAALQRKLDDYRQRPGCILLIARDGDTLIGYVFVTPRVARRLRHTADLNMGLRTDAAGRGVGTSLLRAALERVQHDAIVEVVYLMVRSDNTVARRMYASAGFREVATLTDDIKIGQRYYDGVLMSRRRDTIDDSGASREVDPEQH
jgi:putative acetyltransferase